MTVDDALHKLRAHGFHRIAAPVRVPGAHDMSVATRTWLGEDDTDGPPFVDKFEGHSGEKAIVSRLRTDVAVGSPRAVVFRFEGSTSEAVEEILSWPDPVKT